MSDGLFVPLVQEFPITLEWYEIGQGAYVGCQRQIQNLAQKRHHRHGLPEDQGWQRHIEGALGEMVVAKWRRVYWSGNLGRHDADDVGRSQVRYTVRGNGCLILHDDDKDYRPYILVTGKPPHFIIRGWVYGRQGKQQRWWRSDVREPAYFVPQSALLAMSQLPADAFEPDNETGAG